MKIKSLLLIALCGAASAQAGETKSWGQWLKSCLFANPLVEKYKKQAAVVGGVAVVGAGAVWYACKRNKKPINRFKTAMQNIDVISIPDTSDVDKFARTALLNLAEKKLKIGLLRCDTNMSNDAITDIRNTISDLNAKIAEHNAATAARIKMSRNK